MVLKDISTRDDPMKAWIISSLQHHKGLLSSTCPSNAMHNLLQVVLYQVCLAFFEQFAFKKVCLSDKAFKLPQEVIRWKKCRHLWFWLNSVMWYSNMSLEEEADWPVLAYRNEIFACLVRKGWSRYFDEASRAWAWAWRWLGGWCGLITTEKTR